MLVAVAMPSVELLTPFVLVDWIVNELVLASLKNSFRASPVSRLMPLKLASCAVLSSWSFSWLNCVTRFAAHDIAAGRGGSRAAVDLSVRFQYR